MFSEPREKALSSKLSAKYVRTRQHSGLTLSYIEGWHTIAEANRILGYDAWDRPPLAVVDEELVPEAFWKPQPPKLDRQGLISVLTAGRDVPGAVLGNAPMTISVRTK